MPPADVFAFDPASEQWTVVTALPVHLREPAATLGPDGRIYVVGGLLTVTEAFSSTVYVYDPIRNEWYL
jgi:N-acetylneuraminic acid mutarotase